MGGSDVVSLACSAGCDDGYGEVGSVGVIGVVDVAYASAGAVGDSGV